MAEFASYEPGTPCWVDLSSPDVDASVAFYSSLFGWEAGEAAGEEYGGYRMFLLRGKMVAGLGPVMGEGQPAAWNTYVSVENVDKTAEAFPGAGGAVLAGPMEIPVAGRMAVFADSTGAAISVWEPGEHRGAELANEPGAFCWNELYARDVPAARAFYPAVFGWEVAASGGGPMEYYEFKRGGRSIAGMMPMPDTVPAEVPPFWLTYFAVADTDAAVGRVRELGGSVIVEPTTIPIGRFSVLMGPHREQFAVIALQG